MNRLEKQLAILMLGGVPAMAAGPTLAVNTGGEVAGVSAAAIQTPQPVAANVCVSRNEIAPIDATPAEAIASRLFARIGVALHWPRAGHNCPAEAIVVSLATHTPEGLLPHALAYALPYEGTHIRVFLDRIHRVSIDCPSLEGPLLAHVLAHEITHILQGLSVHSASGVMKARWDQEDYDKMTGGGLAFTPEDVILIRNGMAERAARSPSAIVAAMDQRN
jgi:hypothetical protein